MPAAVCLFSTEGTLMCAFLPYRVPTGKVSKGQVADMLHLIFARGLDNVWRPQRQHGQAQVFWQLKTDNRVDFAGAQTRGSNDGQHAARPKIR